MDYALEFGKTVNEFTAQDVVRFILDKNSKNSRWVPPKQTISVWLKMDENFEPARRSNKRHFWKVVD